MAKALKNLSDEVYLSHDDPFIDFSSAGLYLVGLQTTVATVACAATSVASCWLMPSHMVSAVRTLAITALVAFVFMRKPIRVGRVRGVTTIFNALRPCVVIYIARSDHRAAGAHVRRLGQQAPRLLATHRVPQHDLLSWPSPASLARRQAALRDRRALPGDRVSVVVIAMLPPARRAAQRPALRGGQPVHRGRPAAARLLLSRRSTSSTSTAAQPRNSIHDLAVCIMRCAAAAVWVLGCHLYVIWLPIIQAIVALWARFGQEPPSGNYQGVDTRSDSGLSDAELGHLPMSSDYQLPRDANGVLIAPYMRTPPNGFTHADTSPMEPPPPVPQPGIGAAAGRRQRRGLDAHAARPGLEQLRGVPVTARRSCSNS